MSSSDNNLYFTFNDAMLHIWNDYPVKALGPWPLNKIAATVFPRGTRVDLYHHCRRAPIFFPGTVSTAAPPLVRGWNITRQQLIQALDRDILMNN